MRRIILASGSPRRKELLKGMGLTFEAIASDFDEQLDHTRSPHEVAIELGVGKAEVLAVQYPDAIVIGGDTIVTVNGCQLGKAEDIEDANHMLQLQSGHGVDVTSSAVVLCKELDMRLTDADTAVMLFKSYDKAAIDHYLSLDTWQDKAGAMALQSGGDALVDHIEGDYGTVLGLPTHLVKDMLAKAGIAAQAVKPIAPVPQLSRK